MITLVFRIVFLLLFLVVVSQGIFYLFCLSKTLSGIPIDTYAEIRNSIDQVIEPRLKLVYPATFLVGLAATIFLIKSPGSPAFITTAIAFLCVSIDLLLAIRFNIPINTQFHQYATNVQDLDWESLRSTWLKYLEYRGVVQVIGFLSLLAGLIKG